MAQYHGSQEITKILPTSPPKNCHPCSWHALMKVLTALPSGMNPSLILILLGNICMSLQNVHLPTHSPLQLYEWPALSTAHFLQTFDNQTTMNDDLCLWIIMIGDTNHIFQCCCEAQATAHHDAFWQTNSSEISSSYSSTVWRWT